MNRDLPDREIPSKWISTCSDTKARKSILVCLVKTVSSECHMVECKLLMRMGGDEVGERALKCLEMDRSYLGNSGLFCPDLHFRLPFPLLAALLVFHARVTELQKY